MMTMNYLMTYLLNSGLGLTKSRAAFINSAYDATLAVFRALGVLIGLKVKPTYVLLVDFCLLFAASAIFHLYSAHSEGALYLGAILMGAAFGTAFGNFVAFLSNIVKIDNLVFSIIGIASNASAGIFPVIIGGSLVNHSEYFIYQNIVCTFGELVTFVTLLGFVRFRQKDVFKTLV